MPPKRKAVANTIPSTKKQKSGPSGKEFSRFYASTLKLVNNLRDENNERNLVSPFVKLPSIKLYPDYYTIIKNPITIADIQKKLAKGKYPDKSADEFLEDFKLLYDNAIAYNDPDSWIVKDALKIYDFVKDQVNQFQGVAAGAGASPKAPKIKIKKPKPAKPESTEEVPEEEKPMEITYGKLPEICTKLLKEVMSHDFTGLGVISEPFVEDIDPKEYPEYFKIIKKPTSFNNVLHLLEKRKLFSPKLSILDNLQRFYDATILIFSNAQLFNDPSSLIHQDAVKLNGLFDEKYNELKAKVEAQQSAGSKLKLKLKNSVKKEQTPKVKLNLKLKSAATEQEEKPVEAPKKRGRKKKAEETHINAEEEEGIEQEQEGEEEEGEAEGEKERMEVEDEDAHPTVSTDQLNPKEQETELKQEEEPETRVKTPKPMPLSATLVNSMGKSLPTLPIEDAIIQNISVSSSMSHITNLTQQAQQTQYPSTSLSRSQAVKHGLFPTHAVAPTASLFEYRFPSNGYSSQSYTLTLPPDTSSFITLKVSLHNLLHEIKRPDLLNGQGYVNSTSDDEFQCKLFVNDDEVSNGGDVYEEKKTGKEELLTIQYDLKLSYGLNILNFECKVSPNLSKKIKKSQTIAENEEVAGRHTRHQLQQLKMTWDVENFNFIIVCNSP